MANRFYGDVFANSTSVTIPVLLRRTSNNQALTGVTFGTINAWYWRQGGSPAQIPGAALGSVTAAHVSGGWFQVSSANMPGLYRFDVPNAAFASGADWVVVSVKTTNSYVYATKIDLQTNAFLDYGLDHLVSAAVTGTDVANSSIMASLVSQSATPDWDDFDNTQGSLQALYNGAVQAVIDHEAFIPSAIDLVTDTNTLNARFALVVTDQLGALPTTAEIDPGTIEIERRAYGDTAWSTEIQSSCSESAGLIYYDANIGPGFQEGDSLRVTFNSQKVTIGGVDYEISTSPNGLVYHTYVRPNLTAAIVNSEVADVVRTDTTGEPSTAPPPATASMSKKIDWLYMGFRNRIDSSANLWKLYNDSEVEFARATLSDDGSTFERGEIIAPP